MLHASPLAAATFHGYRAASCRADAMMAAGCALLLALPVAIACSLPVSLGIVVMVAIMPALLLACAIAAGIVAVSHALAARRFHAEHAARLAAPVSGRFYALRTVKLEG